MKTDTYTGFSCHLSGTKTLQIRTCEDGELQRVVTIQAETRAPEVLEFKKQLRALDSFLMALRTERTW